MVFLSMIMLFLTIVNYVNGEFLQMVPSEIDFSRVIKSISGVTITACYMQCSKDEKCDSFGMTENFDGQLHICHLMQKSSISTEEKGVKTIRQGTGLVIKPSPVNGGFSAWKKITRCSSSCGVGRVTYNRSCDNPKPQHGGADCCGDRIRTKTCFLRHCPVNGGFSAWKGPTHCSSSCGVGHVTYNRSCDNPKPQHGGADCEGVKTKTEPCLLKYCPVCYQMKNNGFGEFTVWKTGQLKTIRLIHISGYSGCSPRYKPKWGCPFYGTNAFQELITDERNKVIFPESIGVSAYTIKDATLNDDVVTLTRTQATHVYKGQKLRIWFQEDLVKDAWEGNNSGTHCIFIELVYE